MFIQSSGRCRLKRRRLFQSLLPKSWSLTIPLTSNKSESGDNSLLTLIYFYTALRYVRKFTPKRILQVGCWCDIKRPSKQSQPYTRGVSEHHRPIGEFDVPDWTRDVLSCPCQTEWEIRPRHSRPAGILSFTQTIRKLTTVVWSDSVIKPRHIQLFIVGSEVFNFWRLKTFPDLCQPHLRTGDVRAMGFKTPWVGQLGLRP